MVMAAAYLERFVVQRFEREGLHPLYRLEKGFAYRTEALAKSHGLASVVLLIPPKFEFDGSSVPRLAYSLEPPGGRSIYGSSLHDFGYWFHRFIVWSAEENFIFWVNITREDADNVVAEAWRVSSPEVEIIGLSGSVPWLMERAVRTFGWSAWPKKHLKPKFSKPTDISDFENLQGS